MYFNRNKYEPGAAGFRLAISVLMFGLSILLLAITIFRFGLSVLLSGISIIYSETFADVGRQ